MIPLCDIATLFASRGHHATIITTPVNAQIIRKSIPSLRSTPFPSPPKNWASPTASKASPPSLTTSATSPRSTMPSPCSNPPSSNSWSSTHLIASSPTSSSPGSMTWPTSLTFPALPSTASPSSQSAPYAPSTLNLPISFHSQYPSPHLPQRNTAQGVNPIPETDAGVTAQEPRSSSKLFAELDGQDYIRHYEKNHFTSLGILATSLISCRTAQETQRKCGLGGFDYAFFI
ncbi:hypothetical protein JHK86_019852 [Glycine max]|nr:hypothetical protein JHK86_019852 [Glycine max]